MRDRGLHAASVSGWALGPVGDLPPIRVKIGLGLSGCELARNRLQRRQTHVGGAQNTRCDSTGLSRLIVVLLWSVVQVRHGSVECVYTTG
ncbi:hypothetical protein [Nocardia salmonicida]|uniref:hypothetical protein n=1 Tax=Nocardia salmonicida TaxID=53431 RepID=UPI003643816F